MTFTYITKVKIRAGTSQEKVFAYLQGREPQTAQQVGDALYEATSSCAKWSQTGISHDRAKLRQQWAAKLLNTLAKKGAIQKDTTERPYKYCA